MSPKQNNQHFSTKEDPDAKSSISFSMAITVLRRWWTVVLPLGVIASVLAALVVYVVIPRRYEASALLWIAENRPFIVDPPNTGVQDKNFASNQLGLLESDLVLIPVVSRPEIASIEELEGKHDPVDELRKLVITRPAFGTEHFHVRCQSTSPENAAAIVNAITESYMSLIENLEASRQKELIRILDLEREKSERDVETLRENVRQLAILQTGVDPFSNTSSKKGEDNTGIDRLQSQLTQTIVEQKVLESESKAIDEQLNGPQSEIAEDKLNAFVEQNPSIREIESLITAKQRRLDSYKEYVVNPESSVSYQSLKSEIESDRKNAETLRQQVRDATKSDLQLLSLSDLQNRKTEINDQLRQLTVRAAVISEALENQVEEVQTQNGESFELEVLRSELARANDVLYKISDRAFAIRTEQRSPARIKLLLKATEPRFPLQIMPFKEMAAASLLSFFIPYGLAFLWEIRLRRVETSQQLESKHAIKVIGEVAKLPPVKLKGQSTRTNKDRRLFEESVDNLRTILCLSEPLSDFQVLAVTSAASGEGKTTLAAQLAMSISRSTGAPTLLIDGDMRMPDLHQVFGIDNSPGLAELLATPKDLATQVIPWGENLHILPAGSLKRCPHRLTGSGEFTRLIQRARSEYKFIIIDTPPLLAAGESMMMASVADACLLCAMRDISREDQVAKAYDRAIGAGLKIVGCVFNGVPTNQYSYAYGRYDFAS